MSNRLIYFSLNAYRKKKIKPSYQIKLCHQLCPWPVLSRLLTIYALWKLSTIKIHTFLKFCWFYIIHSVHYLIWSWHEEEWQSPNGLRMFKYPNIIVNLAEITSGILFFIWCSIGSHQKHDDVMGPESKPAPQQWHEPQNWLHQIVNFWATRELLLFFI